MSFKKILLPLLAFLTLSSGASAANNSANVVNVANIATLQALGAAAPFYPSVNVASYSSGGVGGGIFNWNPSSTASGDSCTVFAATGVATGRYIRQAPISSAYDCGAVADGSTDASSAINAGLAVLSSLGGGSLKLLPGSSCYAIKANISVTANTTLQNVAGACEIGSGLTNSAYISLAGSNSGINGLVFSWSGSGTAAIGCANSSTINTFYIQNNSLANATRQTSAINLAQISSETCTLTNGFISNNYIHNVNYGILLGSGLTASSNITISDNQVLTTSNDAIEINTHHNLVGVNVIGNILDASSVITDVNNTGGYAVGTNGGDTVTITGNTILGCRISCFEIESDSSHFLISANHITQTSQAPCFRFPQTSQTVVDIVIDGNTCIAPAVSSASALSVFQTQPNIKFSNNHLYGWGAGSNSATFTGSISGTTLTVSGISGTLVIGNAISGSGIPGNSNGHINTTILAQLTGSAGGNGTYTISTSLTVGSESMATVSAAAIRGSSGEDISGNFVTGGANNSAATGLQMFRGSSADGPATPSIRDNHFDSYYTVYSTVSGGTFGNTILSGTMPTAFINSGALGPTTIEGIVASGSIASTGTGTQNYTLLPAITRYIGAADFTAYSTTNAAQFASYGTNCVVDTSVPASNCVLFVASASGGSPTTGLSISKAATFVLPTSPPPLAFGVSNLVLHLNTGSGVTFNWVLNLAGTSQVGN